MIGAGGIIGIILGIIIVALLLTFLCLVPFKTYFMVIFSGHYVSAFKLVSMKLRKINYYDIAKAYILAKDSKFDLKFIQLEIVSISGGNPCNVVTAMVVAQSAKLPIDFEFARAIDMAGLNVTDVVNDCVRPKVLNVPEIKTFAQDNMEVRVKISLTLKTNLKNYLTGVTEETISARAVEAILTKIANTKAGASLVTAPQELDKVLFASNIDVDSKYELVSVDIQSVELVGERYSHVEKEKREKEKEEKLNELEYRRLVAVANEQEMKAKTEEMKAKIAENEAEVQAMIAKAIELGKTQDVVDYYTVEKLRKESKDEDKTIDGESEIE